MYEINKKWTFCQNKVKKKIALMMIHAVVLGDAWFAALFRPALRCLQEISIAALGRDRCPSAQSSQSNHVSSLSMYSIVSMIWILMVD